MTTYRGKRALDLMVAVPTLILSLPVQAAIACAVRVFMGRPITFRQRRPGLNGRPFELVKFRTMTGSDSDVEASDDERITRLGHILRSTSLDELPTLWNVVRGEMSMVGPRPLLICYLGRYTPEQARRHHVLPGITGLAQVNGRNALSWEEKFALDVTYVETASLLGDLRILAQTVGKVLRREGIAAEGTVTMPVFLGTESTKDPS